MSDLLWVGLLLLAVLATGCVVWFLGLRRSAELGELRSKLEKDLAVATATLNAERGNAELRAAGLELTEAKLREAFTALSSQALHANNQAFLDLAKEAMGTFQQGAKLDLEARQNAVDRLVKPLQEGLKGVDEKILAFDKDRIASAASLHQHLQFMAEAQKQLTGDTQALVRALRAPQGRGQWGEMQLRRVVELAGMIEHCDFAEQNSVQTEDGKLRPDLIVSIPGNKVVVVDSKAPLSAYLDAMECTDEDQRGLHLRQHAKQVRSHIAALADKDYANQFAQAPDFVVMFLPGEAFFSAACQADPNLIDYAIGRNVIPASPTTLVTVLKAVHYGWQQERIARNSEEIRDEAMQLYARMCVVGEHLAKIKKGLDGAVNAYNNAVGSLESRVLPTARRLKALGAGTATDIEVMESVDAMPRLPAAPELVGEGDENLAADEAPLAIPLEIDPVSCEAAPV